MNNIQYAHSIYVEDAATLRSPSLYWNQWMIARNARDIGSRRMWLDEMSLEFANHGGRSLCFRDGQMYQLPDLDEAFGDDEDMRWLSLYIACDGSNLMPRHFSNKIERLRLINLFLKFRYPQCISILTPIPILPSDY